MIGYGFDGVGWVLVHDENARGTVTFSENMCSNRAVLDGTVTPKPPRQVGRAKSSHSVSLTLSRPVSAWMKRVLIVLYCIVLYCIVLNYYTGTPLSPEDYFPGSPVKVEQQTYTYTTHNTVKSVSKSVNQSAVLMVGGCHIFPLLLEVSPCHPISFDHWSSLELLGHLHPPRGC